MYTNCNIPADIAFPNRPVVPGYPPKLAEGEMGVVSFAERGMSEYRAEGELRGCLKRLVGLIGVGRSDSATSFTPLLSSFRFYYNIYIMYICNFIY